MIWYNIIHYWLRLINISGILEFYRRKRDNDKEINTELEEGNPLITNTKNENIDYPFQGNNAVPSLPP